MSPTREALHATLDTINARYGRGTLRLAAEGLGQQWQMRCERVSPCYTTRFAGLPRIGAREQEEVRLAALKK